MSGLNILNIAKESLLSHQTAISLTGSNISNVNTPGYTRQRPVFSSSGSVDVGLGQVQLSVGVEKIERVYDQYLQIQINENTQDLGYSEARKEFFERIEVIFNESSGSGISDVMNKFWGSWDDLSLNPAGQAERTVLVSSAQDMADMFSSYSESLLSVQKDANAQISEQVHQVNNYLSSIADLNEKVMQTETGNGDTNALRDDREELLKGLSEIVDIQNLESSNGSVDIFLSNGQPLVESGHVWELGVVENSENSSYCDIVYKEAPDESINNVITGGKIAGLIDIRDVTCADYLNDLNDLAGSIISEVNEMQRSGFDMNKNLGENFFVEPVEAGKEARDLIVNPEIADDLSKVAASETINGDGENARNIADLKDRLLMGSGMTTFNGFYAGLQGRIGQDVADAERRLDHTTSIMAQLTNKREAVSGVSIDEEMINLIKYQNGYDAAAKLCNVANELIDTLLNLGN